MKRCLWVVLGALLAVVALLDESGPEDPGLARAVRVVRFVTRAQYLEGSAFLHLQPEGRPTQWVGWMFSRLGARDWPPSDDACALDQSYAVSLGMPIVPSDVAFVPILPDPERGPQLVLAGDDAQGFVALEAYLDPLDAPVWTGRVELPRVVPAPMQQWVADIADGRRDELRTELAMGAGSQ